MRRGRSRSSGGDLDQRRALLCLTQAVYYEAGFEPLEGRRAVAQVVLNRMRHPAFPKSVCGVVYQGAGSRRLPVHLRLRRRAVPRAGARRLAAGRGSRPRGARRLCRDDGRRGDPLSRRLCRAALGAAARQGRADRPAHLLSLAGRVGPARGVHRPLHRRAARPAVDAAAACRRRAADRAPSCAAVTGPITDGTVLKRAPNDVGGLLDTSKGWTLHIPGPEESAQRPRGSSPRSRTSPRRPPQVAAAACADASRQPLNSWSKRKPWPPSRSSDPRSSIASR